MASVAELHIYPLKGGMPVSVPQAELTTRGLAGDRLWGVVHEQPGADGIHRFVESKPWHNGRLSSISATHFGEDGLALHALFAGSLVVADPRAQDEGAWKRIRAGRAGDYSETVDAGDDAAAWCSDVVGAKCRLVRLNEVDDTRQSSAKHRVQDEDKLSLAKGHPLLVTSRTSWNELTGASAAFGRAAMKNSLRANLVIDGEEPFAEDWSRMMTIGKWCQMVLVRPGVLNAKGSGQHAPGWTGIAGRRAGEGDGLSGAFFGQYAIPLSLDVIKVGDTVTLSDPRQCHPALEKVQVGYKRPPQYPRAMPAVA